MCSCLAITLSCSCCCSHLIKPVLSLTGGNATFPISPTFLLPGSSKHASTPFSISSDITQRPGEEVSLQSIPLTQFHFQSYHECRINSQLPPKLKRLARRDYFLPYPDYFCQNVSKCWTCPLLCLIPKVMPSKYFIKQSKPPNIHVSITNFSKASGSAHLRHFK